MSIRVLIKDHPRSIALATDTHALVFRHSSQVNEGNGSRNTSTTSLPTNGVKPTTCMVEFSPHGKVNLEGYRTLSSRSIHGTLGLITVQGDVYLCVVSVSEKVASVRAGETVQRIKAVEFHCLNRADLDHILNDEINPYPTDTVDEEGYEVGITKGRGEPVEEHPCMSLKKLLSGGSFYYSADFDLTRRLQDRSSEVAAVAIDSLDSSFLWNSFMIQPLVSFRSRLAPADKDALDGSRILTSAIRGYCYTIPVPASSSPARSGNSGLPSNLTLISRLSCRRAGTRFNARGIDDDGQVANFVESETLFTTPAGLCFSYVQVRGSIPIFWEQASGLLPGQQKVTITRSSEATQPAFDKHMEELTHVYGVVHIVNLLSYEKPAERELTSHYANHVRKSPLNAGAHKGKGHELLKVTDYDFHAETRQQGYEAASYIVNIIQESAESYAYYLSEDVDEQPRGPDGRRKSIRGPVAILEQEGVFRTNCLDCLDRTNLVQTIISRMALEAFLAHRSERATSDFWMRHSSLWADNGDSLSKIYAGTGALKSSFTRHGKMSFAGALADARKSATRLYINNFADKGRQNTMDMLLGRLGGQTPVHLFDPINDWVTAQVNSRAEEYTSEDHISISAHTFNVNGKTHGIREDLSPWLCPDWSVSKQCPEIVAVGFQEIVELSPQQIMSTDPARRQAWEEALKETLNINAQAQGSDEYILLRSGQLVGLSLSIFVKVSSLKHIKNVEGSIKKTGMSGMAGNKGAVAIRMDYANTSLCFVTAHLAAGFANYDERNQDYKTIHSGLRFQRDRDIDKHDTIIWLGDFNYRIGLSNEKVRPLIQARDFENLYANDQLNLQMVAGYVFQHYSEARITFLPTYKYDNGTDEYDTSDKARIPAWCDRILRKGNNIRQILYNTAPLRFSDHRPVFATFKCTISIVDASKQERLTAELFHQRRSSVGSTVVNGAAEESDDEDLLGYDPVEPGLPPASSDKRKWWLDNSQPAKSTVKPPAANVVPNPHRPSNPFSVTNEPDWVKIQRPLQPTPGPSRGRIPTSDQVPLASARKPDAPPYQPRPQQDAVPSLPTRPVNLDGSTSQPMTRSPSNASVTSTASLPSRTLPNRKPAPPIPAKKPSLLSNNSSTTLPGSFTTSDVAGQYPPPPRRLSKAPPYAVSGASSNTDAGPALPPRRAQTHTMGLMDDDDSSELKGWEVLKPS